MNQNKVVMKSLLLKLSVTLFSLPCFASQLAFTLQKSDYCSTELCVHGTFKKGEIVTILSKESEKTCTATTGETFTAEDEMLKFPATKLMNLKGCKSIGTPFLAVLASSIKYVVLHGTALSANALSEADKKVKASKAFKDIYEGASVYNYEVKRDKSYATYTLAQLKQAVPSGLRYSLKNGKTLDVIWHKVEKNGSAEGALFGVYLDQVSPASGVFKISAPYVFLINDKVHVLSTKSCQLGCGENTNQVYQLDDGGFKEVYSNSDFST